MIEMLPNNYATYEPWIHTGAVCDRCGGALRVCHDHDESDWPYVFRCDACIEREARERKEREAPIRRFEHDGAMLRWWIDTYPESHGPQAWVRLMGMILSTDSEIVEAARWKA